MENLENLVSEKCGHPVVGQHKKNVCQMFADSIS